MGNHQGKIENVPLDSVSTSPGTHPLPDEAFDDTDDHLDELKSKLSVIEEKMSSLINQYTKEKERLPKQIQAAFNVHQMSIKVKDINNDIQLIINSLRSQTNDMNTLVTKVTQLELYTTNLTSRVVILENKLVHHKMKNIQPVKRQDSTVLKLFKCFSINVKKHSSNNIME